jgi:hypothetical protein
MPGKPRREGYLLVDHSFSPGITAEELHAAGLPGPAVGPDKKGEFSTLTCSHCNGIVILNPLRTRDRHYCPKCDSYVCDGCAAIMAKSGVCDNFTRLLDYVQESNARMEEHGLIVTGLPDLSPLLTTVTVPVTSPSPSPRQEGKPSTNQGD